MRTLIKLIALIIILFQLIGCKNYYLSKYCTPKIVIKDSIRVDTFVKQVKVIEKKDSIVYKEVLLPNNSSVNLKNPCDSLGKLKDGELYFITNKFYEFKLKVKNGELVIEQKNDSIQNLFIELKEKNDSFEFVKSKLNQFYESSLYIDNTQHLTKWQKFKTTIVFDFILFLIGTGIIIFKIRKLFI